MVKGAPIAGRLITKPVVKQTGEAGVGAHANRSADIGDGQTGRLEQNAGAVQTQIDQIAVRRLASGLAEGAKKLRAAETASGDQFVDVDVAGQMLSHEIDHAP